MVQISSILFMQIKHTGWIKISSHRQKFKNLNVKIKDLTYSIFKALQRTV